MFFNLKEAAEHGVNIGTNWSSYSHSAIRFGELQDVEQQPEYVTNSFLYLLEDLETYDLATFLSSVRSEELQCRDIGYVRRYTYTSTLIMPRADTGI